MESKRWGRAVLGALVAAIGLPVAFGLGAAAQPFEPATHPMTINAGTCAQPVAQPAFLVGDTEPWGEAVTDVGPGAGGGVLTLDETVGTQLDGLLQAGQPYALLLHASAEAFGTYLACGEIAGSPVDGKLAVGLRPVGASGYAGVVLLDRDQTGLLGLGEQEVRVTAYLVAGLGQASPTASPAATAAAATPAAASPAAGGGAGLTVDLRDIYYDPNLLTIPATTAVAATFTNQGEAVHNFSVTDHNNAGLTNLGISVTFQPGESKPVDLDAPVGDYYFFCNQPGHEAAGMFGYLQVREGATITTAEATVTPRAGS